MNDATELSAFWAIVTATLLITGSGLALTGSLGLLRLQDFYQRVHAPTLSTSMGAVCIAASSMIYFSALGSGFVLHELLIVIFITMTTPVSLMVLIRAARLRDRFENKDNAPDEPKPASDRPQ